MTAPTCFINIRGVLHPRWAGEPFPPAGVEASVRFCWSEHLKPLAQKWNLNFVLRTSDLFGVPLEDVKALAPDWLSERIVGRTADVWRYIGLNEPRKVDTAFNVIRKHVQSKEIQTWVAIDHAADGWPQSPDVRSRLVLCDVATGITNPSVLDRLETALFATCSS